MSNLLQGEAVAWEYRATGWSYWASITREQFDHYRTTQPGGVEIRELFPTPQPATPVIDEAMIESAYIAADDYIDEYGDGDPSNLTETEWEELLRRIIKAALNQEGK